jgi:hypothetical protein
MNSAVWRALLLSMCAIVALLAVYDIVVEYAGPNSTSIVGQWGDTVAASSQPYHLVVLSIDPGHGADIAGLRPGDLIDIRANTPVERFWLFGQPVTGRPVTILARRGTQQYHFTIVPQPAEPLRRLLLSPIWLGFIWIALFAGVIAWRRSDDPQMRTLCLLLVTYAFWETTNQHYESSESLWVLTAAATANVLGTLTVAFWAACAGSFAPPRSRLRRGAQWLCYALVGTSIAVGLVKIVGIVTLQVDPIAFGSSASGLPFVLACLAATACTALALSATQAAERQRAIWSLFPAAILIFVGFGAESAQGIMRSYELAWGVYYVASGFNIVTPMVLTYVALNRRLLDIGFVLNRAAVFAIVSTTLIGTFVIVEWIANEWLSANHTTGAVVGMLVALALGLSMRYIHRFADRFVDRVLFRKRYEDEAALRRFAHEAGFITDSTVLLERAESTVKASTGANASILVLDDGRTSVDENDPALVALRAWHKPLDLELFPDSALHGQFAFPMVARGELVAVMICGSKQDSEVYAPDESEALQLLADGVGSALSLLSQARAPSNATLAGTLAELRAAIRDLRQLKA